MDITEEQELQAKEFLKRAEIRTMKKDLQKLREADALKERDKIINVKTVEEEKAELEKKRKDQTEKLEMEKILSRRMEQEREAEEQIKDYAEEAEKQQIFLHEAQRLSFQKQIDDIDKEKEPALALDKNRLLLEKRKQEEKLNSIVSEEKKIEDEEKFIAEKEITSNVPSEKKSLEERRGELESQRQKTEKNRWVIEKEVKDLDDKIKAIDDKYKEVIEEKNKLREKIAGADKSLREIYSKIIKRVEEKRKGLSEQQKAEAEKREKLASERKEQIQREQWTRPAITKQIPTGKDFLKEMTEKARENLAKSATAEEEQRRKFLEDIEKQIKEEGNKQ